MTLLESGGFTKFAFDGANDFDEEVFDVFLVIESFALFKEVWFATEETGTVISLI
jgi:hypothetical protein